MALIACHECGSKVSDEAKACPQCGVKPKAKTSLSTKLIAGLFAIGIISSIIGQNSNQPPAVAAPTKESTDPNIELRFQKTVLVAKTVKAALRNPDSVQWGGMLANDDASVICIEYRAQNGFGGMNLEYVAFAKGKLQTSAEAWNKHCAEKKMYDMKRAKYAI